MKRIISLIIVAVMTVTFFAGFVFASETKTDGDYTYTVLDGTAVITAYSGNEKTVSIPEKLGGYTVVGIGKEAFIENEYLTYLTIPDTVTYIDDDAFYYCTELESVKLSSNLKKIGNEAFAFCYYISELDFPETLETIGEMAFLECSEVSDLYIPKSTKSIGKGAFYGMYSLESVEVSEDNSFYSSLDGVLYSKDKSTLITYPTRKSDTDFEVPDEVISIEDYAFYYVDALEEVYMYEVENIGDFAFSNCGGLSMVQMPLTVKTIGDEAFMATAIKYISIPDTIISIGAHAFGFDYIARDNVYLPLATFVVYGKSNSVAEWYAKHNGFRFNETSVSNRGDVNDDLSVDIVDVTLMRAGIIKIRQLSEDETLRADVNSDLETDIVDVAIIRSWIVNYQ